MINYKILDKVEELQLAYPLLLKMYPNYSEIDLKIMLKNMLPLNYKILLCLENEKVLGLSGFWIMTKFWSGKYCEIDNFIIDEEQRNKGIGQQMIELIVNMAKAESCLMVTLDAYTHNHLAHKFFFREGFIVKGFHFVKEI